MIATRPPPPASALRRAASASLIDFATSGVRMSIMPMPTLHVQRGLLVAGAEHLCADFANEVAGPGLDVALRAALHQQHERAVAEATEQVVRLARLGDQSGELADDFLDRQRTDVVAQRFELVGLDRDDLPDARP